MVAPISTCNENSQPRNRNNETNSVSAVNQLRLLFRRHVSLYLILVHSPLDVLINVETRSRYITAL